MTDKTTTENDASAREAFVGKVVWITGASSGIGEGMSKGFAQCWR